MWFCVAAAVFFFLCGAGHEAKKDSGKAYYCFGAMHLWSAVAVILGALPHVA